MSKVHGSSHASHTHATTTSKPAPSRSPMQKPSAHPNTQSGVKAKASGKVRGHSVGVQAQASSSRTSSTTCSRDHGRSAQTRDDRSSTTVGGGVNAGVFGANASVTSGHFSHYRASERGGDCARGVSAFEPARMKQGDVVSTFRGAFGTVDVGAKYRGVSLGSTTTHERGTASSVAKVGPHQVRVATGPEDAIHNQVRLGLSTPAFSVGITRNDTSVSRRAHEATLDLNSRGGREAYLRFLRTGDVPRHDARSSGISGTAVVQREGDSGGGSELASSKTHFTDGRRTSKQIYRDGSDSYVREVDHDRRGRLTRNALDATLRDLPDAEAWSTAAGHPASSGTLHVHMNGADLSNWRRRARVMLGFDREQGIVTAGNGDAALAQTQNLTQLGNELVGLGLSPQVHEALGESFAMAGRLGGRFGLGRVPRSLRFIAG